MVAEVAETDVLIENLGSIAMITPITPAGQEWVLDNVSFEDWQVMGCSIALEPRCVEAIAQGLEDAGLTHD